MFLYQYVVLRDHLCDDLIRKISEYTINQTINGKKEGLWKEWYYNFEYFQLNKIIRDPKLGTYSVYKKFVRGQLKKEWYYKNDDLFWQKHDLKEWHDNGQLQRIYYKKTGNCTCYDINGKILNFWHYVSDKHSRFDQNTYYLQNKLNFNKG